MQIYNTLTKKKEEFNPGPGGNVTIYVCGPTVYNFIHIGNARCYVVFDVVYRYLEFRGYKVIYARNITDIDDKIINQSIEEGIPTEEISSKYEEAFFKDMSELGVEASTFSPRATEHIPEIVETIEKLIKNGNAYAVDGDVFYSVESFKDYGKLSGRSLEEMEAGKRVEVDPRKRHPMDFALWKSSKPGEPSWESPWGRGRPGWHIECSAMSSKYLGFGFDIHGGGQDLIFPHHENEIAQAEAAEGKSPFVRFWMHNGFLTINKEKMAKSLGNFILVKEVIKQFNPDAIRLLFLGTHYRSPIDYSVDGIKEAEAALERIKGFIRAVDHVAEFRGGGGARGAPPPPSPLKTSIEETERKFLSSMDDDFNTAAALGAIFELVKEANRNISRNDLGEAEIRDLIAARDLIVELSDDVFGLRLKEKRVDLPLPEEQIELMISEREEARKAKQWKRSDEIREELRSLGIVLEDTPRGTRWKVSS